MSAVGVASLLQDVGSYVDMVVRLIWLGRFSVRRKLLLDFHSICWLIIPSKKASWLQNLLESSALSLTIKCILIARCRGVIVISSRIIFEISVMPVSTQWLFQSELFGRSLCRLQNFLFVRLILGLVYESCSISTSPLVFVLGARWPLSTFNDTVILWRFYRCSYGARGILFAI